MKLRAAGLGSYFSFGGYGSDHGDRAALIRAGFQRGTTQLGCEESSCRRVVIGDTRLDVAAAKANNAETLGVLTGGDTREELVSAGAECIVETLEDPRAATFLDSPDAALRRVAARGLARDAGRPDLARRAFHDDDPLVRIHAAGGLLAAASAA